MELMEQRIRAHIAAEVATLDRDMVMKIAAAHRAGHVPRFALVRTDSTTATLADAIPEGWGPGNVYNITPEAVAIALGRDNA